MKLHYISNLEASQRGGGFSLRNTAAFEALSETYGARYFGPISPPSLLSEKLISAARRRLGRRGAFHFFSARRLGRVRNEVAATGALSGDVLFFNGFTPWIGIEPDKPYIAWNDCSFHDYIRIYHNPDRFDPRDIARIEAQEARWLKGAQAVILRSQHFAARTAVQYGLDPDRVFSLPNFSTLTPPAADSYAGTPLFLFMSTNFRGKNGPVVLTAFDRVRARHPLARLAVVGDLPPERQRRGAGIDWVGFLDPSNPEQDARKRALLAEAVCLVHPTNFDTNPAVLVEAAYFGCPAISTAAFAIPEIVTHGETGFLVADPQAVETVASHMTWMLEHSDAYVAMRRAVRAQALARMTLDRFKAELVELVSREIAALPERSAPRARAATTR